MDYSEQLCEKLYDNQVDKSQFAYGSWLRASIRKGSLNIRAKWLRSTAPCPRQSSSNDGGDGGWFQTIFGYW